MFERWRNGDDLTDEDLQELTAEEEVMDWMACRPLPVRGRPDWLPEGQELSAPLGASAIPGATTDSPTLDAPPRRRQPVPDLPPASQPPWALAVAGALSVLALALIGLAGVASAAGWWWLG